MVRLAPPGTACLAPGTASRTLGSRTRDGGSGITGYIYIYGKPGTGDGKLGYRDGESEPGTRDQGAPVTRRMAGPGTVCLLATTWTMSLSPETASLAPVTVLCSVRVYTRGPSCLKMWQLIVNTRETAKNFCPCGSDIMT